MRAAIVGYDVEGKVSALYWQKFGYEITICDENAALTADNPNYTYKIGDDAMRNLHEFDVIVRTAGWKPSRIFDANSEHPEIKDRMTTSVNEFLRVCPSKNVIGVTGTKGKGTTSTLIAEVLGEAGFAVHLGGNIGIAPLDMLSKVQPDDWVVLELGAFQLIDIRYSPHIAVCLMVVPEHMDWFSDMTEYMSAKQRLFAHQTPADLTIFNAEDPNSDSVTSTSNGLRICYDVPEHFKSPIIKEAAYVDGDTIYYKKNIICKTGDVHLRGRHNLQNICAAICATWGATNGNIAAIKKAIDNFQGLEHRIEFVRELDGVSYYNDSFSTTPETAIACMESFEEPKIMILGGSDKKADLYPLANGVLHNNVRQAILIDNSKFKDKFGDTAPEIAVLLKNREFSDVILGLTSMTDIVNKARELAQPGDVVLLSTGCASFGQFKDYKDRGNQFKQVVNSLQKK